MPFFVLFYFMMNDMPMKNAQSILSPSNPVLLFDGVCNLCSGFVQFVIKIDPKGKFRFASLQSEIGQKMLTAAGLSTSDLGTVVLIHSGNVFTHSDVALESARILGGPWSLFYAFSILPRFLRDGIYNWVARNRYRWFGKKDACMMPTPDIQQRFLDIS